MKNKVLILSIILLVGGATLLGALNAISIDHAQNHGCPFTAMRGDCPSPEDSVALAAHHISGIEALTLAIPPAVILSQALLTVTSILFFALLLYCVNSISSYTYSHSRHRSLHDICRTYKNSLKQTLLYWIGLHNKKELPFLQWAHASITLQ